MYAGAGWCPTPDTPEPTSITQYRHGNNEHTGSHPPIHLFIIRYYQHACSHPQAVSPLRDIATGETFQPILASTLDGRAWAPNNGKVKGKGKKGGGNGGGIKAVVFCSGKVYFDAIKVRGGWVDGVHTQNTCIHFNTKHKHQKQAVPEACLDVDPSTVLVVRLEELSPFPRPALERLLDRYLYVYTMCVCVKVGRTGFPPIHIETPCSSIDTNTTASSPPSGTTSRPSEP